MIVVRLTVDLPVETVFDYFLDFRNENQWNVVAHDIVLLTDPPIGVGSKFSGQYDRMGPMEYEIQEFDRPRFARVTGNAKFFRWLSTFSFTADNGSTTVECTMDPQPKGLLRIAKPLMAKMVHQQMERGLASLKTTLEAKAVDQLPAASRDFDPAHRPPDR
jgi:polyketide cyclase/dehydrase/lipid transport protein